MVILESDWYRESLEYNLNMEKLQELLITRKFISLLILESDRYEISEKNPRKKLFRPCDFFKSHKWIKIYPKQRFFTTITKNTIQEKTILFLEPKRILTYIQKIIINNPNCIILDHISLKELPNIYLD